MSRWFVPVAVFALMGMVGCGKSKNTPQPLAAPTPLSVAEWKQMPIDLKYDEVTFDRLKLGDPKLQSEAAWQDFMINVIVPERKIDIPGVPGVAPPPTAS